MKINIIALIFWVCFLLLVNATQFVHVGWEASAAADQVKTGSEYLQARAEMQAVQGIVWIFKVVAMFFIGWNIGTIGYFFFTKNK